MSINLLQDKGVPLAKQDFTWQSMAGIPISKLNDDAFTRVRVILMNGIKQGQNRFLHAMAWTQGKNDALRLALAQVRRSDHHQQTTINWLLGSDHSALETTIGYEQVAIEITAALAQQEPNAYLAQTYRFGLLEDFDHMYRFATLLDRVEGKDANNILQGYTDILPGRPTAVEHRAPIDDLRHSYEKETAHIISKFNVMTLTAAEHQTRDYYMTIGPQFADPLARQLYAEIASIEEQHTTQYGSLIDPSESPLAQWLLREANEVYNYMSCIAGEETPRVRAIWERFLDYELGQLAVVRKLFQSIEGRDPAEILPDKLPDPIPYKSQREFVRQTLATEVDLRANGTAYVPKDEEGEESLRLRAQLHRDGVPSEIISAGYIWNPGTELARGVMSQLGEPVTQIVDEPHLDQQGA